MRTLIKTAAATAFVFCAQSYAHANEGKFKELDTDRDNRISSTEHQAGATAMFAKLDVDKDGKVTANEMQSAMENKKVGKKMKGHEVSVADKIKMIDTDGDGALTQQEHADGSTKMFSEADKDGDGLLTAREMKMGYKEEMKKASR